MLAEKPTYIRMSTFLGDVDIMSAYFIKQVFPRHYHDGFGLGCITGGAMEFNYRGEKLIAPKGYLNSVNPDEAHDGKAFDEQGWSYRMLYFGEDVFRNVFSEITGREQTPYLYAGVMGDAWLSGDIRRFIDNLVHGGVEKLAYESGLLSILSSAIVRHTDKKPLLNRPYKLGNKIQKVKQYIRENIAEKLSINELAEIAGVSPFHFIRSFQADTGVSPYEYVMQTRAEFARDQLMNGVSPVKVAVDCGYCDQSHMNRWLKKLFGVTPSNMSKIIL